MAVNFAALADEIYALQHKIDKINDAAKEKTRPLERQIKEKEEVLQLAMQDAGLTEIKGRQSKAELKQSLKISFSDAEAFFGFVKKNNAFQLFHRRIAIDAYTEIKTLQKGKDIPGLSEYLHTQLKVQKA